MDYWHKVEEEASKTKEKTLANSEKTWQLLRDAITLYAEGFPLAKTREETAAALAKMGLISQNFNFLKAATDLAVKGYYIQSISLLRNVYENWLAFWYLAKYPDDANLWLDSRWDQRPPNAETMKNRIDHPDGEAKLNLQDFKKVLDRFAHTDPVYVLSRLRLIDGQTVVGVGVEYIEEHFDGNAYYILMWLGNMLDAISRWILDAPDWSKRYKSISEKILEFINIHTKETTHDQDLENLA